MENNFKMVAKTFSVLEILKGIANVKHKTWNRSKNGEF
jgi:hypothetical protein